MSYSIIAAIARSQSLADRLRACHASELVAAGTATADNLARVQSTLGVLMWAYAASPGWAAAWASAVANEVPDPGADPGVITDGMVLSAAQSIAGMQAQ